MKAIDIHSCIGNPQNSNIRKLESNILEKAYYGGHQAFEELGQIKGKARPRLERRARIQFCGVLKPCKPTKTMKLR